MINKTFFYIIFFLFITTLGMAQNLAIGEWQVHSSYNACKGVVEHNGELYVACQYGMFKFNLETRVLSKLSKVEGLSENHFSAIGYNKKHGVVIIGYSNGNIDLLKNGVVYNISSIKKAQNILGTKTINHIEDYGNYVFVSTDFGVVKIDVENPSIKETYKNLTIKGDVLKVNQALVSKSNTIDSLFLATSVGVIVAPLNSENLIDYSQWTLYDSTNSVFTTEKEILNIAIANNEIYALAVLENRLFKKTLTGWKKLPSPVASWDKAYGMFSRHDSIYISYKGEKAFVILDEDARIKNKLKDPIFNEPGYIFTDSKNRNYVIDYFSGFFFEKTDHTYNYLNPNGPSKPEAFNIEYIDDKIYVLAGGYHSNLLFPSGNQTGYYTYDYENAWQIFDDTNWPTPAKDLTSAAWHKTRKEVYFSSFSYGIMMKDQYGKHRVFGDSSLITTAEPPFLSPLSGSLLRMATVETDLDGNVWFTSFLAGNFPQLYRVNADGTWTTFRIPNLAASQINYIKFDLDNNIWALSRGGLTQSSVLAISNDGRLKKLFSTTELYSNPRYIEVDLKGDVWVGTEEGIVIIKNENQMNGFEIERPIIDGRYLLENQIVKGITVDGANRKWISTSNGVWVFNEDGTKEIHHFTVDNCPLLSNDILDICIHPETGEAFIATSFGVNSYRAESTESNENLCTDPIKVFPNPVPAGFSGYVGINGVPENALVKITDISGHLVFESNAFGGQAIWDTKDINGNKARTGVYIAYISSEDTENTCITKIAVVE